MRPRSATLPSQHDKTLSILVGDENPISEAFVTYQYANQEQQNTALENLKKLLEETIASLNILTALITRYPHMHVPQPQRGRPKSTSVERLPTIQEYMETANEGGISAVDQKIVAAEGDIIAEMVRRGRSTTVASITEAEQIQYARLLKKITGMFPRLNTAPAELNNSLAVLKNILENFLSSLLRLTQTAEVTQRTAAASSTALPISVAAPPAPPRRSWLDCCCNLFRCCQRRRDPDPRHASTDTPSAGV